MKHFLLSLIASAVFLSSAQAATFETGGVLSNFADLDSPTLVLSEQTIEQPYMVIFGFVAGEDATRSVVFGTEESALDVVREQVAPISSHLGKVLSGGSETAWTGF